MKYMHLYTKSAIWVLNRVMVASNLWASQVASGKESPASAGDVGLIPGLGRSPWGGNGNPLQHSCLGNPMDLILSEGWRSWKFTKFVMSVYLWSNSKESNLLRHFCLKECFAILRTPNGDKLRWRLLVSQLDKKTLIFKKVVLMHLL